MVPGPLCKPQSFTAPASGALPSSWLLAKAEHVRVYKEVGFSRRYPQLRWPLALPEPPIAWFQFLSLPARDAAGDWPGVCLGQHPLAGAPTNCFLVFQAHLPSSGGPWPALQLTPPRKCSDIFGGPPEELLPLAGPIPPGQALRTHSRQYPPGDQLLSIVTAGGGREAQGSRAKSRETKGKTRESVRRNCG